LHVFRYHNGGKQGAIISPLLFHTLSGRSKKIWKM